MKDLVYSPYDRYIYFDPEGKEYSQTQFSAYIDRVFPQKHMWDTSTAAEAERKLTTEGGWRKEEKQILKPPLAEVVGKYMVCGQHAEPRYTTWNPETQRWDEHKIEYNDISEPRWRLMAPSIYNTKHIRWGCSTWLINEDGSLTHVGADYDSSG